MIRIFALRPLLYPDYQGTVKMNSTIEFADLENPIFQEKLSENDEMCCILNGVNHIKA